MSRRPSALPGRGPAPARRNASRAAGVGLVVLAVAPLLASDLWLTLATSVAVLALAALGLSLVVGQGGVLDLGHAVYFGLGAYATVIWARDHGGSVVVGAAIGVALAVLVSAVVFWVVRRASGLALALATLAVAVLVRSLAGGVELTGRNLGATGPTRTIHGTTDLTPVGLYVVVLVVLALATVAVARVRRSRLGRALALARHVPVAAEACGVATDRARAATFVAGAAVTGVAGTLSAISLRFVEPEALGVASSLELLTVAVIGGLPGAIGPILGAIVVRGLPEAIEPLSDYQVLITGVAFLAVLLRFRGGLVAPLLGALGRTPSPAPEPAVPGSPEPEPPAPGSPPPATRAAPSPAEGDRPAGGSPAPALLEVAGLAKRFGAVDALRDVSFVVRAGRLHGLVGANGSGKTTTLDVVTGFEVPDAGELRWDGAPIVAAGPQGRARLGMARTFQQGGLSPELTLRQNVMVGGHRWSRGGLAAAVLPGLGRRVEDELAAAADGALALVGLADLADERPESVGAGVRRRCELARCLAARPRLVVLDEPAAGLDDEEVAVLREVLLGLRAEGVAVLLVEHDLELVGGVCDTVTLLDAGTVVDAADDSGRAGR